MKQAVALLKEEIEESGNAFHPGLENSVHVCAHLIEGDQKVDWMQVSGSVAYSLLMCILVSYFKQKFLIILSFLIPLKLVYF